ncbi:hypothetical protein GCM10023094_54580 [Rhodococcus olei]|uniref:Uncharacterized protein n=1 Tax=Rhodococcus olei TaxID=2161675 RepID=A0ABP8PPL0_9NOCA
MITASRTVSDMSVSFESVWTASAAVGVDSAARRDAGGVRRESGTRRATIGARERGTFAP